MVDRLTDIFNAVSFTLDIDTTNEDIISKPELNRFENEDSKIIKLKTEKPYFYLKSSLLTKADLKRKGYIGKKIKLIGQLNEENEYHLEKLYYNKKGYFTIRRLIKIIEDFEKIDRPNTNWLGVIDTHHIYFEGLKKIEGTKNNFTYCILWGS